MTAQLLAGQCAELIFKLDITSKINIVGYSMGGAVAKQVSEYDSFLS